MKAPSAIAAAGLVTCILTQAFGEWSPPLKIHEQRGFVNFPQLAAGAAGNVIALWSETTSDERERLSSRTTSAGAWGWGADTPVSDEAARFQPPVSVAMRTDGTVVAVWRQAVASPTANEIVVSKFVPGSGWGPIHKVAASGFAPALALAPDGRAHLVYVEGQALLATTLPPGEDAWAPAVVLTDDVASFGESALVAGAGFAYAAYPKGQGIDVAVYDASGWHPGTLATATIAGSRAPALVKNGMHVALLWSQPDGPSDETQHVLRLTSPAESFATPRSNCNLTLAPDGGAIAVCEVKGDAVPGCTEPGHGGPQQLYYGYLEAYRRAPFGAWSPVEVISSAQKRVRPDIRLLSNSGGRTFVLWQSDVPCGPGSTEILARSYSPLSGSWEPEERLAADRAPTIPTQIIASRLVDATVDAEGAPHALILHNENNDPQAPGLLSQLFVLDGAAPKTQEAKGRTP